jgi:hypothetical protein
MNEGKEVIILFNQQEQTDRNIPNNKMDILIQENEERTFMLIGVAISGDRNVIKKETEKTIKYEDLTLEIQCTWNVKTKVIPIITGATGKNHLRTIQKIPEPRTGKA